MTKKLSSIFLVIIILMDLIDFILEYFAVRVLSFKYFLG